jgi:release factor glutamine methyltransferase
VKHERPGAKVFATDLSPEAVDLAMANARRLELDVAVLRGDLLAPLPPALRGWVDLVVSNPPYLAQHEYEDLPPEVRADPPLALLGGLEVYERLGAEALRWLRDGGVLAVEIGAPTGDEVSELLGRSFAEVRIHRDLAGRDRVVVARRP